MGDNALIYVDVQISLVFGCIAVAAEYTDHLYVGCSGSPIIYCSIVLYTIVYIVFIVVADRLFIAIFHSIDFTL